MARLIPAFLLLALASGCGDSATAATTDAVVEGWRGAGLEVGELAVVELPALGKAECRRGSVKGVETTLCTYPSEEAARAAHAAGLELIGQTTGAALTRGPLLLIVADRDKADPEGRTINAMTRSFRGS